MQMKIPKYRPSLSQQEMEECIDSLEQTNPKSTAISSLKIYLLKQSLGKAAPTNHTYVPAAVAAETPEQKEAREANELAALSGDLHNFARKQSLVDML